MPTTDPLPTTNGTAADSAAGAAASSAPELDVLQIRAFAETLAGRDGRDSYVRLVGGRLVVDGEPGPDTLFKVPARGGAPTVSGAAIRLSLGDRPLQDEFDAFWWSESAIEKFVLPYYLRLVGSTGIAELEDGFRRGFRRGVVAGLAHRPDSQWAPLFHEDPTRLVGPDTPLFAALVPRKAGGSATWKGALDFQGGEYAPVSARLLLDLLPPL